MRLILFPIFLCLVFELEAKQEIGKSKIYLKGTLDQAYEYTGIQLRTDLMDTTINNVSFIKFKTEDFTKYPDIKETRIYYESFSDSLYLLLNSDYDIVHQINFKTDDEQSTTFFGEQYTILVEISESGKNNLAEKHRTIKKYFQSESPEIYVIIAPDLKTVVISSNGQFYTKQLFGDWHDDIVEGLTNNYQVSTQFDIQIGDEVQLLYRAQRYNDTTDLYTYNERRFLNIKYIGDTIINNAKALKIQTDEYSYFMNSKSDPEYSFIELKDTGYFTNQMFIPFQTYKTELLVDQGHFLLQGIGTDTINGFSYQKIVQEFGHIYRRYILPYFPLSYMERGNVQGVITYKKIKGLESGVKRKIPDK